MIRYVASVDEFRQLAAVAAPPGTPIVNGGYAYDTEILERLPRMDPGLRCAGSTRPSWPPGSTRSTRPGAGAAARSWRPPAGARRLGCELLIRVFDPATLPALYLVSRTPAPRTGAAQPRPADELWSEVLVALDDVDVEHRPQLVLNHRNPLVRRMTALRPGPALRHAVEALYGQALLLGHHPIRPADAAAAEPLVPRPARPRVPAEATAGSTRASLTT